MWRQKWDWDAFLQQSVNPNQTRENENTSVENWQLILSSCIYKQWWGLIWNKTHDEHKKNQTDLNDMGDLPKLINGQ